MEKIKITVMLDGCDDSTYIPMEVTKEEQEFLEQLSVKSLQYSTYGCMPTMSIALETEIASPGFLTQDEAVKVWRLRHPASSQTM